MSSRCLRVWWLAVVVAGTCVADGARGNEGAADDKTSGGARTAWTVDDLVMQERASGWELNRDGTLAVWVKQVPDTKKDRRVGVLMLTDLAEGTSRRLTTGNVSVSSPAFGPEGRRVTFLSSRDAPPGEKSLEEKDAGPQLWQLDLRGGEAERLTTIAGGVGAYAWLDDGEMILSARERRTRRELELLDPKDDTRVVESARAFRDRGRKLFRFDPETKSLVRLTADLGPVESFAASRDGRFVVAMHGQNPSYEAEGKEPPRVMVHDLEAGSAEEVFAERKTKPRAFAWRPDSRGFYCVYPESTVDGEDSGAIRALKYVDAATREVTEIELDWERGLGWVFVAREDGFIATLADGVRPRLAEYVREVGGYRKREIGGEFAGQVFEFAAAESSERVLFVTGSASDPDHVMTGVLSGGEIRETKEIYRPNDGFEERVIARTEVIRYAGAGGEEVEAVVNYPHDYEEGRRYPLVLITHGGPHGADYDRFGENWAQSPNLYAQRGAFVLRVNYHGSSDYGLAFGESIKGKYYELEIKDMFAGIAKLVDEGKVDAEQMGLVGWSNGAILSTAAITLAHLYAPAYDWKFKACAPGAGDVNWTSDYGNCRFGPTFDDFYLGGSPWEMTDLYVKKSPLFYVERVTTPTIIFFGTEDTAVPTEQGWEWYRALHLVEKAPVRFLLFPGEPHGLQKLTHQRRKLEEELKWFDRYLFEVEEEAETAVKEGSPLDTALRLRGLPQEEGAYGVMEGARLVPETVPYGAMEVTRFEVTRAQWAAFDGSVDVDEATRNYPMTGVTLESARAYVEWLNGAGDGGWRILREEEFTKLAGTKAAEQNTLDWWAGYAPPPKEAEAVRKQLLELPVEQVLEAVGSRAPGIHRRGPEEVRIFDVGGNAAELVMDDDDEDGETAKVMGLSAVTSDDGRREGAGEVPAAFVGLRLAREMAADGADDE